MSSAREGSKPREKVARHAGFLATILLLGIFGTSAIISFSPAFENEIERFQRAVYNTERTIFTTYFYWYRSTGMLEATQQVINELSPDEVSAISDNLADPPADWPGPTALDGVISFNATGDGKNYSNQLSHHPPSSEPSYNSSGHVIGELNRSLPKYENDANDIIVNISNWLDWMNPGWHEWEMRSMMRAGIDVAMPVYWWTGPETNFGQWAHDGLIVLNDTLTTLRGKIASEHTLGGDYRPEDVPRIAMFYDTTLMKQLWAHNVSNDNTSVYYGNYSKAFNDGPGADLTDPYWEHQFYLRIIEFYDVIVNGENLFTVTLNVNGVEEEYCVAWLYGGSWFSNIGPDVFNYCREQFETRYGKKLLFVGGSDWQEAGVDGVCGWGACCNVRTAEYSRIPVGGHGPGYYNLGAIEVQDASYISRDVNRYKKGFQEAITSGAAWLHVETWNEFLEGTDICWSQQHGHAFIDATREIADMFHAMTGSPPAIQGVNFVLVLAPLGIIGALISLAVVMQRKSRILE